MNQKTPNICRDSILLKFGKRVRIHRKEQKLSQVILGEKSVLARSYLSDVERGQRNISLANIEKLSKALNVTIRDFFE